MWCTTVFFCVCERLVMLTATGSTATIMALNTRQGFNSNSSGPMAPRVEAANRVGPIQGKQQTSGYIHALFRLICWLSLWDILNSASLIIFIYFFHSFIKYLFVCLEFFVPLENFSLILRSLIHTWSFDTTCNNVDLPYFTLILKCLI